MTSNSQFTLASNEGIRNYFYGSDKYIPTSELIYLSTRPMIRPNFMTEVEDLVKETTQYISEKGLNGFALDQLTEYAIELANLLPEITQENASKVLEALRGIYILCNDTLPPEPTSTTQELKPVVVAPRGGAQVFKGVGRG